MGIRLIDGLQVGMSNLREALEAGGFSIVETTGKGARDSGSAGDEEVCFHLDLEFTVTPAAKQPKKPRIVIGQVVLFPATGKCRTRLPSAASSRSSDGKSLDLVGELIGRLSSLRRSAPSGSRTETQVHEVIQVYDLEIDVQSRRVHRRGQEITLTRLEFNLLEFLARHRGQVVSADRIRDYIYKGRNESQSNTISVFIGYLRRKIDRDFAPPLILTRWCQGYLLRDT